MEMHSKERLFQKVDTYFSIVSTIASLSNSQTLKVGCMAIKKDFTKIASFGYNGSYPGAPTNPETGGEEISMKPGCSGMIHAEINMALKFREHNPEDYFVLLTHSPCRECTIALCNAGFKHVYWMTEYRKTEHLYIFDECGVVYGDIDKLKHRM